MKVAVESINSYQRKLSITFPATRVKSELDKQLHRYAKQVKLPGFRQGKVPRKVVEARFGPQIRAGIADDLINAGYREAVQKESLEPVSQPNVDDMSEVSPKEDFVFTVSVEVKPDVELKRLEGVDVVYPPAQAVDESEIDGIVASKLEGKASLVAVERPSEKGDMVMASLEAKDGDEVVYTAPGTMVRTAGDPNHAGMEDLLVGVSVGGKGEGEVVFAADCRTAELAGRTLTVAYEVLGVNANEAPELTDAIAEELGYEGGIVGMREAIRAQLAKPREEMARNQARANVLEAILAENPFEVPAGMVEDNLRLLLQQIQQNRREQGMSPQSLSFNDAQMADLRMRAAFAAKASLVLEKVVDAQGFEITDEDLEAKFQELADANDAPIEAIRAYYVAPPELDSMLPDPSVSGETLQIVLQAIATRTGASLENVYRAHGAKVRHAQLKDLMLEERTIDWLLDHANHVDAPEAPAAEEPAAEEPAAEEPAAEEPAAEEPAAEEPAAEEPAAEADLSFLKGSVGAVKEALETGDHDGYLAAVLEAEQNGKARKGALAAIEKRIAAQG